jgi:hypothetical protein
MVCHVYTSITSCGDLHCDNKRSMFPSKQVAALLVLVVVSSPSPSLLVSGKPSVSKEQKDKILEECDRFIRLGYPIYVVSRHSPCCDAVRAVENRDMDYVVLLLTNDEKDKYSISKILALHGLCELPPASLHHHQQVK